MSANLLSRLNASSSSIHRCRQMFVMKSYLSTTPVLSGQPFGDDPIKNPPDFKWPNQMGTFEHHRMPKELLENEFSHPICEDTMGIRWPGYWFKKKFVYVKEMEPELVVPDLTGFQLKPYVSYQTEEVDTPPLTAKELFNHVYASKIAQQFEAGQLEEQDLKLNEEDVDNARLRAMQTGSDLFEEFTTNGVRAPLEWTDY